MRPWFPLLVVLLQLAPVVLAHHNGDAGQGPSIPLPIHAPGSPVPVPSDAHAPSDGEIENNTTTGIALVDSVRGQILAAGDKALGLLNDTLARQGISTQVLPAANANVLNDTIEPGQRVGGVGEWQVLRGGGWGAWPGAGWNGTYGLTTTNLTRGTYAKGTSLLLSPAVDLSAYPLKTGPLPFANTAIDVGSVIVPFCEVGRDFVNTQIETSAPGAASLSDGTCVLASPDGGVVQDQINLIFRHRMSAPSGMDGGQVRVFVEKPDAASVLDDLGDLVLPMRGFGAYGTASALDGTGRDDGFTGVIPWETVAFDLTPYAGRTIWIGFVFASARASERAVDPEPAHGWFVDNVEVRAPALAHDLKLWGIQGPTLRLGPGDPYPRVAPGSNVTVSPVVLNAGANGATAWMNASISIGESEPSFVAFERNLTPGEVWAPSFTIQAPVHGPFSVAIDVSSPGPSGSRRTDPSDNNRATATYVASEVRNVTLDLEVSTIRADFGEPVTATATIVNGGNVPETVRLSGNVSVPPTAPDANATNATLPASALVLAPGETRTIGWSLPTAVAGRHAVNATLVGLETLRATAAYFVHASPPPLYASGGVNPVNTTGWYWSPVVPQPPGDEWAWSIPFSQITGLEQPALIARPTFCGTRVPAAEACVPDALADAEFDRLRLMIRYTSNWKSTSPPSQGFVTITYPEPTTAVGSGQTRASEVPSAAETVWRWDLPVGGSTPLMKEENNLAWRTIDTRVRANDTPYAQATEGLATGPVRNAKGYADLWSLQGLEVRVTPPHTMPNVFYVDEILLTAVPAGADESERIPLIHVTGDPETDANVDGSAPNCAGAVSCWSASRPGSQTPAMWVNHWKRGTGTDLFTYGERTTVVPVGLANQGEWSEVLYSPNITLRDAFDPTITLDHAYFVRTLIQLSGSSNIVKIFGVAFVEAQYLRDDGQWSDFVRLVPEGGYPSVYHRSINGSVLASDPERYDNDNGELGAYGVSADGFYYPAPCSVTNQGATKNCDQGGYVQDRDSTGRPVWRRFDSPREDRSVFRLRAQPAFEGVDFSDRVIRLGLRAPRMEQASGIAYWNVRGLLVTPFPDFAIDGAVAGLRLETPYDWREIGVGPGTTLLANVTVENRGLYPQAFVVTLNATRPDGAELPEATSETGILAPGQGRSVRIPWAVPGQEGVNYTLRASVAPRERAVRDEFLQNDNATLGADGALFARSRRDFTVSAAIVPQDGPAGFPRHAFVSFSNTGNQPIDGITVTRAVHRMAAAGNVPAPGGEAATFRIPQLPLGARDLPVSGLVEDAGPDDFQYAPPELGQYVLDVTVQGVGRTLRSSLSFSALAKLYSDRFEDGIDWRTDDPSAWTLVPGPEGTQALSAAGESRGVFAPGTDISIESPPLPLAHARSAVLTLQSKYDLERGYDGARLEVSLPDGSWAPLVPIGANGRSEAYPDGALVGSNPLAAETFPAPTTALTGDSHDAEPNVDGWAPYSFDLAQVPGLQDFVPLEVLAVPHEKAGPLRPIAGASHAYSASWLQTDSGNELARWEMRNEGDADGLIMDAWWSGPTSVSTNAKLFNSSSIKIRADDGTSRLEGGDLYVSWWDHRPGASERSWKGVGAVYNVSVVDATTSALLATQDNVTIEVVERRGTWSLLRARVHASQIDAAKDEVQIHFSTWTPIYKTATPNDFAARATNTGWLVANLTVRAAKVEAGRIVDLRDFTADEGFEWNTSRGWIAVCVVPAPDCPGLPPRPAAWEVATEDGPDGLSRPMWKLNLPPKTENVDARVVTPVIDLTKTSGSDVQLDLVHKYDLFFAEQLAPPNTGPWMSRWYQGGAVEAQAFDPATGEWGPWTQVFARGFAPGRDVGPLAPLPEEGQPYTRVFGPSGQTFERFPREYDQSYVGSTALGVSSYAKRDVGEFSYAFSGLSPEDPGLNGFHHTRFDLTPFAGRLVRVAFHAWTGNLNLTAAKSWTIADATIEGNVLDAGTPRLRLRLATDGSDLRGSLAIADVEIAGVTNSRDVGIQLTSQPTVVRSHGVANVSGVLRNFGPNPRQGLALGISVVSRETNEPVDFSLGNQTVVDVRPQLGYQRARELPTLAPAGSENDSATFSFDVYAGDEDVIVRLQALDSIGAEHVPVIDDIAARAAREWKIAVVDRLEIRVDEPRGHPSFLEAPGVVNATAVIRNTGSLPVNVSARFSILGDGDATLPGPLVEIKPGGTAEVYSGPLRASKVGNHRLGVSVETEGGAMTVVNESILRVGTNETILLQSFEPDEWPHENWTAPGFRATRDPEFFGGWVLLYGVNDTEYAGGARMDEDGDPAPLGVLTLPEIRVADLPPRPTLTFWQKSRMSDGVVAVAAKAVEPDDCYPTTQLLGAGRIEIWSEEPGQQAAPTFREVPLDAALVEGCEKIQLQILVRGGRDQGWRVDGITLSTSRLGLAPANASAQIGDSARKQYPFQVENPGLVNRTFDLALDAAASLLSEDQVGWVRVEPATMTLAPGEKRTARVLVETPPAVGAFPQPLTAVVKIVPADAPYDIKKHVLALDFDPRARPDLSLQLSVDGRPLVPGVSIEESTPHEIAAAVRNTGGAASVPTSLRFEAVDARTGASVWNDTQPIDRSIQASVGGDDVFVASTHWTPPSTLGPYLLRVTADPLRLEVDYDRSNDDLTIPLNVTRLRRPDLEISPSTATASTPDGRVVYEATPGSFVHVQASVRNVGITDAEGVVVRLVAGSSVLKEQAIGTLKPNESHLIQANHLVPDSTVSYRFIAFTPYSELSLSNNAVSLLLPVFPPDIGIDAVDPVAVSPGEPRVVTLNVTDSGPYPQLVNLSLASGGGLATLSPATLALRPGESRATTLTIDAPSTASAGRHALVLEAMSATGARTQRTIPVDVAPRPAAEVVVRPLSQDPRNATMPVEVQNTGNVQMPLSIVVRSDAGDLGVAVAPNVSVGGSAVVLVPLSFAPDAAPGQVPVTVLVTGEGNTLASRSSTIALQAWGDVDALSVEKEDGHAYRVSLLARGTRDFALTPRLEGAPRGTTVAFEPARIEASPGESLTLRLRVTPPADAPSGIYAASLRLVPDEGALDEPGARRGPDEQSSSWAEPAPVPVALDLRRASLALHSPQRVSSGSDAGDVQQWRVKVRNVGDQVSGGERVDLFVDQVLVSTAALAPIPPGESVTVALSWNATPGKHAVLLAVGADGARGPRQALADAVEIAGGSFVPGAFQTPADDAVLAVLALAASVLIARGWRRRGA